LEDGFSEEISCPIDVSSALKAGYAGRMAKTSSHRLVFKKDRSLNLGDAIPCGTRDDAGVRLPFGGRCMVDSIYHNEAAGQFVVTISHYPEVKV
jgi:hypothetical protein